ncbi:MAG TPA: Ig-like domain-containing protein, partial [Chitinophagaceae bacterium]|nr:Ig-like domain-containing protein [Chitinophagaceae bacterium]
MPKIFFFLIFLSAFKANTQECKNCGNRTAIAFHKIEWLQIQKPNDPVLLEQWNKLDDLWSDISYQFDQFFENNTCLFIRQVGQGTQNADIAGSIFKYSIYGIIIQGISDYVLKLWMQPVCSNKIMAETEVRFQLYPIMEADRVTQQAVAQFAPLIKIPEFEIEQRNGKNLPLGGNLEGGMIDVQILDRDIGIGQETGIVLWMKDCDGKMLTGQEISFGKTKGGTVWPATVNTDAEGKAMAIFKLSASLKGEAIIKAESAPINANGCKDLFTGEAIMLAPPTYNVSVHYLKRGTKN